MLGRLRMSVADCITAYLSLNVQGSADKEELAQAVKKLVSQQRLQENPLLKDTAKAGCKV
jgi:DnaJ-domain-containing protein 1